jgi:hypothetical protein
MDLNLSFRFLKLNKLQALTLQREVVPSSTSYIEDDDTYVGMVTLSEDISSTKPAEAIAVPFLVNQMLKYINCKLVFSYSNPS